MSRTISKLSTNIKRERNRLEISQDKLSKMANVTFHTIAKIESGATINPRIMTMKKIAKALKVSIDKLLV